MRLAFSSAGAGRRIILLSVAILAPLTFTGCGSAAFSNPAASKAPTVSMLGQTPSVPTQTPSVPAQTPSVPAQTPSVPTQTPSVPAQPPRVPAQTPSVPPILLFNGTGTLAADVSAWETILGNLKLSYATANSSEMNSMTATTRKQNKLRL